MTACPLLLSTPAPGHSPWLLPLPLFRLLLLTGLVGLVLAVLVILGIWLVELRRGRVW